MGGGRLNLRTGEVSADASASASAVVAGAEQVAPGVIDRQAEFFVCAGCGKVYWQGSHWDRVGRK